MPLFKGVRDQVTANVIVELLTDRNTLEQVKFKAIWKKLTASQCDELAKRELSGDAEPAEIVRENLVTWEGCPDSEGGTIEYSADARDEALQIVEYRTALYESFSRAQYSRKAENRKN